MGLLCDGPLLAEPRAAMTSARRALSEGAARTFSDANFLPPPSILHQLMLCSMYAQDYGCLAYEPPSGMCAKMLMSAESFSTPNGSWMEPELFDMVIRAMHKCITIRTAFATEA